MICTLQGYIHEIEETKTCVSTIVQSESSNIESKIISLKEVLSNASQIASKVKSVSSMTNLISKTNPCEQEEELTLLKEQIDKGLMEINKSVDSEINNLRSIIEIVSNLQAEIDGVSEYIKKKHDYFDKQSPVSEDDDEDNAELEQIRVICSEIESWALTIGSLKSQVNSVKTKPCQFEYENLEKDVLKIEKDHKKLLVEAQSFLKMKTEYYERLQKIDDLCELCNVWLETKSKETLNLIQYHSLKSNGMTTQIAQLQLAF